MAWLRLRDKVMINIDLLASVEARSSAGMAHTSDRTREDLESRVNFCFTTSDGKDFLRYFIPVAKADAIMADLLYAFTGSHSVITLDDIFANYGIRPQDTY